MAADPDETADRHVNAAGLLGTLSIGVQLVLTLRFAVTPTPSPANRTSTRWRTRWAWTRSSSACAIYLGTYVATMAEVAVAKSTGRVEVKWVVCAQDGGVIVNPDGSRQQMEGSITMGLGYALTEEVRFKDGKVLDRNFDTYETPRFSRLPKIETVLVENPEVPASGCGEPPIVNMGAVIANAICDAVGARLLQLPMTAERIQQALRRG
jgi:CO/xanthine dehydrogenase Mo-binding subunit